MAEEGFHWLAFDVLRTTRVVTMNRTAGRGIFVIEIIGRRGSLRVSIIGRRRQNSCASLSDPLVAGSRMFSRCYYVFNDIDAFSSGYSLYCHSSMLS